MQAKELSSDIVGVAVKQSLGPELALHLSHEAAGQLIRENAAEACARIDDIQPFFIPGPYTKEIRVKPGCHSGIPGPRRGGC